MSIIVAARRTPDQVAAKLERFEKRGERVKASIRSKADAGGERITKYKKNLPNRFRN